MPEQGGIRAGAGERERMRLAVSMTRAATLINRKRMVANSAALSAAVCGSAWRRLHISQ